MMNPEQYIQKRLEGLKLPSSTKPDLGSRKALVDFMSKTILSKKFRKYSVDSDFLKSLDSAVNFNLDRNEPIKFALPFGGYKLWRLEEAPEADWAELFSLVYYAYWLKPIWENYEPGVWFDFCSDDVIVEMLDNVPKLDTETYAHSFRSVIGFLEKFLPKNMRFTLTTVGSRYVPGEFEKELKEKMEALKNSIGGLPQVSERERQMIDLNSKPRPDEERNEEWYQRNKLMHDAYTSVSQRRPYYRAEGKLLAFTKPLPNGVAVGTTKTSIAKFWVGVGVLKRREDGLIESVLSPDQLEKLQSEWSPISIEGLEGRNFKKIRIAR
jgi:hypothetical protein